MQRGVSVPMALVPHLVALLALGAGAWGSAARHARVPPPLPLAQPWGAGPLGGAARLRTPGEPLALRGGGRARRMAVGDWGEDWSEDPEEGRDWDPSYGAKPAGDKARRPEKALRKGSKGDWGKGARDGAGRRGERREGAVRKHRGREGDEGRRDRPPRREEGRRDRRETAEPREEHRVRSSHSAKHGPSAGPEKRRGEPPGRKSERGEGRRERGRRHSEEEEEEASFDPHRDLPSTPPDLDVGMEITSFAMHPRGDFIAVGVANGEVDVYMYSSQGHELVSTIPAHKPKKEEESDGKKKKHVTCRCLQFSRDGRYLYRGSSDGSVEVFNFRELSPDGAFTKAWGCGAAHGAPISCILPLPKRRLLTADDDGVVKLWDTRNVTAKPLWRLAHHEDQVTCAVFDEGRGRVVCGSGDGTVSVVDVEKGRLVARSEDIGDEILCMSPIKEGQRLLTGLQSGGVAVWKWDAWDWPSDKLPGHAQAVNSIQSLDADCFISGCDDGLIRLNQVHPNKLLAVVGGHARDAETISRKGRGDFPVEVVCVDHTMSFTASCSHDATIKFHDLVALAATDTMDDDSDGDGERRKRRRKKRTKSTHKKASRVRREVLNVLEKGQKSREKNTGKKADKRARG